MFNKKVLIVGSGPAGSTIGRVLAEKGLKVEIHEKRSHTGGNTYDYKDKNGVLIHKYGPHYFRTNSEKLLEWLSRFTSWMPGHYYVRAKIGKKLVPLPISLATISAIKEKAFSEVEFVKYLEENTSKINHPKNSEEQCLSLVGKEIYDSIFKGYTQKQWNKKPSDLNKSITARIPLRFNWDEKYLNAKYQVMPMKGYSRLMENILDHPNISVHTQSNIEPKLILKNKKKYHSIVYTGPLDSFFDFKFGKLSYRSLKFQFRNFKMNFKQPCVQINYPNDFNYTRTVEIKHVTGQVINSTTISYEYPKSSGEHFYPIIIDKNLKKVKQYNHLVKKLKNEENPIYFIGRLAEFKYVDMDQVFLKSLKLANQIIIGLMF